MNTTATRAGWVKLRAATATHASASAGSGHTARRSARRSAPRPARTAAHSPCFAAWAMRRMWPASGQKRATRSIALRGSSFHCAQSQAAVSAPSSPCSTASISAWLNRVSGLPASSSSARR